MAQARLRYLLGALAACASLAAFPAGKDPKTPQTPWTSLSVEDRKVLHPVAPDWDRLPGVQQQRLMSAARQYPKFRPDEQRRFQGRLGDWAAMSPEQRKAARETFKGLKQLPPAKQSELRDRWMQQKGESREPAKEPRRR